jgi:cytochrome c oxidase subunit 4
MTDIGRSQHEIAIEEHLDEKLQAHSEAHDVEHDHPKESLYITVAVILAALTGLEILTYYVDFGRLFLPALLTLMAVKFLLVALFFMHLKFDAKIFGRLFWSGLILAVVVYVAALATFQVFSG